MSLPVDYDTDVIRQKIPEVGRSFDETPGLGLKVFLLRERGADKSPINQYAPFYLWTDIAAAASFLFHEGGFAEVTNTYGRPIVQTWLGGAYHRGKAYESPVTHAVRLLRRIPSDIDPSITAAVALEEILGRLEESTLHSVAWAIDPRTWELVTLTLHSQRPATFNGELYQVLHVSSPEADGLPTKLR